MNFLGSVLVFLSFTSLFCIFFLRNSIYTPDFNCRTCTVNAPMSVTSLASCVSFLGIPVITVCLPDNATPPPGRGQKPVCLYLSPSFTLCSQTGLQIPLILVFRTKELNHGCKCKSPVELRQWAHPEPYTRTGDSASLGT